MNAAANSTIALQPQPTWSDEDRARAEGIRELLAKPVGLDTLARAVRRALDSGPPSAAA